jgi:hypothetical protein
MDQDLHPIVNDHERGGSPTRNRLTVNRAYMSYSYSSSSSSKVLALFGALVSAKFALRHFKPLGLTNLSRTRTINDLVDSELQDKS